MGNLIKKIISFPSSTEAINPLTSEKYLPTKPGKTFALSLINAQFARGEAAVLTPHGYSEIGLEATIDQKRKLLLEAIPEVRIQAQLLINSVALKKELLEELLTHLDHAKRQGLSPKKTSQDLQAIVKKWEGICAAKLANNAKDLNKELVELVEKSKYDDLKEGAESRIEALFVRKAEKCKIQVGEKFLKTLSHELSSNTDNLAHIKSYLNAAYTNINKLADYYGGQSAFTSYLKEFCRILTVKKDVFKTLEEPIDIDEFLSKKETLPKIIVELGDVLGSQKREEVVRDIFDGRANKLLAEDIPFKEREYNWGEEISNAAGFFAKFLDKNFLQGNSLPQNPIIFAKELSPVDYALLPMDVLGVVLSKCSPLSHIAVVSKGSSRAVVTNRTLLAKLEVENGDSILINPVRKTITINPNIDQAKAFFKDRALFSENNELNKLSETFVYGKTPVSLDNRDLSLSVIVNTLADIKQLREIAEDQQNDRQTKQRQKDIGLIRQELLLELGDSRGLPSLAEYFMFNFYAVSTADKEVVFRTLDINDTDKSTFRGEAAQGKYGLDWDLAHPVNFKNEIKAFYYSANLCPEKQVKIVFPQVYNAEQVKAARRLVRQAEKELLKDDAKTFPGKKMPKNISFGIMVEDARLVKKNFNELKKILALGWIKHLRIGGNDFCCSILGKKRDALLESDFYSPKFLRALNDLVSFVSKEYPGIRIGFCGHAASDKNKLPTLTGLGLSEFAVGLDSYYSSKMRIIRELHVSAWQKEVAKLLSSNLSKKELQARLSPELFINMNNNNELTFLRQFKETKDAHDELQAAHKELQQSHEEIESLSSKLTSDNEILNLFFNMVAFLKKNRLDHPDNLEKAYALLWRYSEVKSFFQTGEDLVPDKIFTRLPEDSMGIKTAKEYVSLVKTDNYMKTVFAEQGPSGGHVHKMKELSFEDKLLLEYATKIFSLKVDDPQEIFKAGSPDEASEVGGYLDEGKNVYVYLDINTQRPVGLCIRNLDKYIEAHYKDKDDADLKKKLLGLRAEKKKKYPGDDGSTIFWKIPHHLEGHGASHKILRFSREIDSTNIYKLCGTKPNGVFPKSTDANNPGFFADINSNYIPQFVSSPEKTKKKALRKAGKSSAEPKKKDPGAPLKKEILGGTEKNRVKIKYAQVVSPEGMIALASEKFVLGLPAGIHARPATDLAMLLGTLPVVLANEDGIEFTNQGIMDWLACGPKFLPKKKLTLSCTFESKDLAKNEALFIKALEYLSNDDDDYLKDHLKNAKG
ncbi:putative PEP-binding protein [Candidatus Margulisiibacteriota bacterium]